MVHGDLLDDGQSEAGPLGVWVAGLLRPGVGVEDVQQVIGSDSAAGVLDDKDDGLVGWPHGDVDLRIVLVTQPC